MPPLESDAECRCLSNDLDFLRESLKLDIQEKFVAAMEAKGWDRTDWARKTGLPEGHIVRLLTGETDFSLRDLVTIARALGATVCVDFVKKGSS